MPKSYSEKERASIVEELRFAAMESMLQKGVKKTTVDELVEKAKIPKGTFYLFYPSKEMLLYDALMQKEAETHRLLSESLERISSDFSIESLTDLLYGFFQMAYGIGLLSLMTSGELDILMRKLPDELVKEHISKDDEFLSVFRVLFPCMSSESLTSYSAAFRAVFFTAAYKREVGEYYDTALQLLIKGLIIQMWEERCDA
ncbi:MAG: TetR/AcrR family transcriptional regulator [Christensenellaceae bacterium]